MRELCAVISCLLLSVGMVTAQRAQSQLNDRLLPQWLTGIIAVAAFLFLAFVSLLVKKAWCEGPSGKKTTVESVKEIEVAMTDENTYESSLDMFRSRESANAYENLVIDNIDDRVTAM